MKILVILQPSVLNAEGLYVPQDSNWQMLKGILGQLQKKTNWHFDVMFPRANAYKKEDFEGLDPTKVEFIFWDFPRNATEGRFKFDPKELPTNLDLTYDLIWNNVPELTRNFKVFFPKIPIINCNYFLDTPSNPKTSIRLNYWFRQVDGAMSADLVPMTCASTLEAFNREISNFFKSDEVLAGIKLKETIWDFGFSTEELDKYKTTEKFDKTTIVFPNRITSQDYTNFNVFLKAVNELYKKRQDFSVLILNPSQKYYTNEQLCEMCPAAILYWDRALTRKEYIECLWKADIMATLYIDELYGGCCSREGAYTENLMLMPKVNEYTTLAPDNYPGFCKPDFSDIVERLDELIDIAQSRKGDYWIKDMKEQSKRSAFENVSDVVIKDIEKIVEG